MTDTPLSPSNQNHDRHVKTNFWHTYLGLVLQLSLFAVLMVVASLTAPIFFDLRNWSNLFKQSVPYAIMALALVLTTRVKGIDLSAGAVFATASCVFAYFVSENMVVPGLILALAIGLAVGSINGVANMFIHIPSAALTMLISAAITFGVSLLVSRGAKSLWDGKSIFVGLKGLDITAAAVASLFVALLLVLALLYFTKLGGEGRVQKRLVFAVYASSALLFSLAACYMAVRLQMGGSVLDDLGDANYLLFAAGAILVSRSARIRFIPVVCALMAALNWTLISNILSLNSVSSYYQFLIQLVLMIAFITPAFLVQRGSQSRS